jgi:hypothetical protein
MIMVQKMAIDETCLDYREEKRQQSFSFPRDLRLV